VGRAGVAQHPIWRGARAHPSHGRQALTGAGGSCHHLLGHMCRWWDPSGQDPPRRTRRRPQRGQRSGWASPRSRYAVCQSRTTGSAIGSCPGWAPRYLASPSSSDSVPRTVANNSSVMTLKCTSHRPLSASGMRKFLNLITEQRLLCLKRFGVIAGCR